MQSEVIFCQCCTLTSGKCTEPNTGSDICAECAEKQVENPTWDCYHQPTLDQEQLKNLNDALEEMKTTWESNMDKIRSEGKLKLIGSQFKNSVDYVLSDITESIEFSQAVVHELQIRGLDTARKTANSMRNEVRECHVSEEGTEELIAKISAAETRSEVMPNIIRYVPCIMHCENRCVINFSKSF